MKKSRSQLEVIARQTRQYILQAVYAAQSGHAGPSLSMVEIMVTLRFSEMMVDGKFPDRFILSKGHAAPCYYAAEAAAGRIVPDQLKTLRQLGSPLQGHPVRGTMPFIDASTGSLGQGLSMGIGYALGARLRGEDRRVYVVLGDGEMQEGQIWEAAMSAAKFKLGNVLAIVDHNKFQNEDSVEKQMPLGSLLEKWNSFGWHAQELSNGHDIDALLRSYNEARKESDRPSIVIANTIKGRGVSFMEGNMEWHSKAPSDEEFKVAQRELV